MSGQPTHTAPESAPSVRGPKCPKCGQWHQAYSLFPPACQYPGDRYTYFVDGKPAFEVRRTDA